MPSFVEIGPVVPEKKNFEGFLPYTVYGHGGHLGHVTWIIYIYIFIAIALDESIFLDVLHFPMKNIVT